jgi:gliding motility-associated protein GldL
MNIGDFLRSKRWKLVQNYIYSWGASVVLIGALFKLEHLPMASVFLGVGLSIEAIIFFVSAFEHTPELPDWKIIYPQLRTGKEDQREKDEYKVADERFGNFFGGGGGGGVQTPAVQMANLPEEQIKNLKESFEKLSRAASGIADISNASVATQGFVKNLNDAAASIGSVVDANKKVSGVMEESVNEIAKSYKSAAHKMNETVDDSSKGIHHALKDLSDSVTKSAEGLKTSTDKVAKEMEKTGTEFSSQLNTSVNHMQTSYKDLTASMVNGFKGLEKSSQNYMTNLDHLNKNLGAINTAYELHLKGAGKVETMVNEYAKGVGEIGKLLNTTVEETRKFNQNTKEINENIQALNNIYGKMLGALNGKK